MTTENEAPAPELLFDFGRGTVTDLERVLAEIEQRKLPPAEPNRDEDQRRNEASLVGSDFLRFVVMTLYGLRLVGPDATARSRRPTEIPAGASLTAALRTLWNAEAPTWAVAIDPYTYHMIMQTVLQFFRANDKKTGERILSIGAGPGLYETYLGGVLSMLPQTASAEVVSLDSSVAMTARHREIIGAARTLHDQPISNVRVVNGDMLALPFPDDSIDQILCIDALQWSPEWQTAIREMARVINPKGLRRVYLVLRESSPLFQRAEHTPILDATAFSLPAVLDALEAAGFQNAHVRQFAIMQGTDATHRTSTRVFVEALHMPDGKITSWRASTPSFTLAAMAHGKK